MFLLQNVIHYLEVGGGSKFFRRASRIFFGGMAVLILGFGYSLCGFKNMATQEAMDSAQLARNIAEGKGYRTLFVRPLSMYLLKQQNQESKNLSDPAQAANLAEVKGLHPDIANPPIYPLV